MATQIKHRRGNTSELETFTPAIGELVMNTDTNVLILGDGVKQGGHSVLMNSDLTTFGGVADYAGTPLYDGLDGTRVTATDNTDALYNCILNALAKNIPVSVPVGHFGFTTGNRNIDLGGKTLYIEGAGHDSILDYVFEDSSNTSTVVISTSNAICHFTNGTVKMKNIRIKGTTNLLNVSGNQNPNDQPDVYFGAVWGMTLKGFGFDLENVETDHFNFRGLTCQPVGPVVYADIKMKNCKGHHCVSTAYWWRYCDVTVDGGEFYRNGRPGTIHTGYGLLNEEGCGTVIVKGATFKENCRKGLDSRALVTTVTGCDFIDNRLKDFDLQQKVAGSIKNKCTISHNTIQYNVNTDFINLCDSQYAALGGTGVITKVFISATESEENLNLFGEFTFTHNTIKAHSGGQIIPTAFGLMYIAADKQIVGHNVIDISGMNVDNSLGIRDIGAFWFKKDNAVVEWEFNKIRLPELSQTDGLYNGVVFTLPDSTGILEELNFRKNVFDIANAVLFARDIGGVIGGTPNDFNLKASDNEVVIRDMKLGVSASAIKTNALDWVNIESFFFGRNHSDSENRITIGSDYSYSVSGGFNEFSYGAVGSKSIRKQGNTTAGDNVFELLIPDAGNNVNVDIKGLGSIHAQELLSTFDATLAKTDYKTSTDLSIGSASYFTITGSDMKLVSIPLVSTTGLGEGTFIATVTTEGVIGSNVIAGVVL